MTCNYRWNEEERKASYILSNIKGIGNRSLFTLLDYTHSAVEILLLSDSKIGELLETRTARAFIKGRQEIELSEKGGLLQGDIKAENINISFIPILSPDYPQKLRNIPDPPFCIYVKGELPEENTPSVAIVGARACSEYGKAVARYFGTELGKNGISVISGMARGIDGTAQEGAIAGGGHTFAILGCGVDICYPPENMELYSKIPQNGGIISEYSPGTRAQSGLFPRRNRIISGLADVLLVVEAKKRSGTYITVTQALEQGKEVYAVPGRITDALSEGCNFLLAQGAGVADCPRTILEALREKYYTFFTCPNLAPKPECSANEQSGRNEQPEVNTPAHFILECMSINPSSLEEICMSLQTKCTLSVSEIILELTKLQIEGKIIGEGNYYRLPFAL